jgi:hypothetical protein
MSIRVEDLSRLDFSDVATAACGAGHARGGIFMSTADAPFTEQTKLRVFLALLWLLPSVWSLTQAHAAGLCPALSALPQTICKDQHLTAEADQVKEVYRALKLSKSKDIVFLAAADERSLGSSVNDCRNLMASDPTLSSVRACVEKVLTEKIASISKSSDSGDLLRNLRKEKFLSLDLLPAYSATFVGVVANWFGDLHLVRKDGDSLTGTIEDTRAKLRFPAILDHPKNEDLVFFGEAGCRTGCFSWWTGQFVLRGKTVVFQVQRE